MALYGYPKMGRFGLGHSLSAWGRCVVWCEQMNAEMLAPRWMKLRIGPYLRGERDKREYFKLFSNKGMVRGLRRDWVLARAHALNSHDGYFPEDIYADTFLKQHSQASGDAVVVFTNASRDNERKHFHEMIGHSRLLRGRFERMVHPRFLPTKISSRAIAIHVRMGDFFTPKNSAELLTNSARLPLKWYMRTFKKLRSSLGNDVPAIVYSDGSDEELKELLLVPGVSRAPRQESVTDLLSMAQAPLLIASGSGLSLWAGFLGQVPSIYYPGRKIVPFLEDPTLEIELADEAPIPSTFIERLRLTPMRSANIG